MPGETYENLLKNKYQKKKVGAQSPTKNLSPQRAQASSPMRITQTSPMRMPQTGSKVKSKTGIPSHIVKKRPQQGKITPYSSQQRSRLPLEAEEQY